MSICITELQSDIWTQSRVFSFLAPAPPAKPPGLNQYSLKLFKADYPQAKCFLTCGVDSKEYHHGIEVWPFEEFITNLPKILGIRYRRISDVQKGFAP